MLNFERFINVAVYNCRRSVCKANETRTQRRDGKFRQSMDTRRGVGNSKWSFFHGARSSRRPWARHVFSRAYAFWIHLSTNSISRLCAGMHMQNVT